MSTEIPHALHLKSNGKITVLKHFRDSVEITCIFSRTLDSKCLPPLS